MNFPKIILILLILICNSAMASSSAENAPTISYPVRFAYIDQLKSWSGYKNIAIGLGVPGYAPPHIYNHIALAFWTYHHGPDDIVGLWNDPVQYFGTTSPFGKTKDQIQKSIKKHYNDGGVKLLISAFGATEFPTSQKVDPVVCATKLAEFVKANNLDGVDVDWEDDDSLQAAGGTGEKWVISFTKKLRQLLPNYILTQAPQAPYFKKEYYKNGGYITVHEQVGDLIDFYNIQFYNQEGNRYDNYTTLFLASGGEFSGTSVRQIASRGIPLHKIVVGKPVKKSDADNTGWMDIGELGSAVSKGYQDLKWYGGVMFWEYKSDPEGTEITKAAGYLKELCAINKNCK